MRAKTVKNGLFGLALTLLIVPFAACDFFDGDERTADTGGGTAGPANIGEVSSAVAVAITGTGGLPTDPARGNIPTLAPLVDIVAPSVVNISTTGTVTRQLNPLMQDPFFRRFFGELPDRQLDQETHSVGSGVIIDAAEGYVVTNNHVIQNADEIVVTLRDRREFEAELIGTDPATDVAILRIDAEELTEIPRGNSEELRVGDFVIAIGNPFGLGQTVTTGIISALDRSTVGTADLEDFIQTDAAINPGNSGGALIDLTGRLIGINTAIIGPNGGNVGIGFAIPVDIVDARMRQLIEFGSVRRGLLGVRIEDMTPPIAEALGLTSVTGAIVNEVTKGSAAANAGIRPGDIILSVDGNSVTNSADLRNKIGLTTPGNEVELELMRRGGLETLNVIVGEAG